MSPWMKYGQFAINGFWICMMAPVIVIGSPFALIGWLTGFKIIKFSQENETLKPWPRPEPKKG